MPALTQANDLVRARNVTASECGALMDKHPYTTPTSIYDRLNAPGGIGAIEQTEAMRLGMFFEPSIAKYAAQKLNLRLRANSRTIEHSKYSLCATPDYFVLGHRMLVEVKLSSKLYVWTDETLQPYIEWQARAQMAVTNRDATIIAALVGSQFHLVTVVRDIDKEKALLQKVDTFWQENVMAGVRPMTLQQTTIIARIEA
jgi:predicted phage-related endonuclease